MTPLAPFPDIEAAFIARLNGIITAGTFASADIKSRMPYALVYRFAGGDNGLEDRAVVGVDVYAGTRSQGLPLAEQVRQSLTATPFYVTVGTDTVVVDSVTTAEAPHEVPYGDTAIRRWVSTYTVTLRR